MTHEEIDKKIWDWEEVIIHYKGPDKHWPKHLAKGERILYTYFIESFNPLQSWLFVMRNPAEFKRCYHHKGVHYFKTLVCLPYVHEPYVHVILDAIGTLLKLYRPYFKEQEILACLKDMKETFSNLDYDQPKKD